MTPKEKAKELVFDKFRKGINVNKYHLKHDLSNFGKAKQCALIAVNEILSLPRYTFVNNGYWQHVKDEIEKL